MTATESQIDAELELGRHHQLISELEALCAQYPDRERLAAQLMLALYRCGRQADALNVYQRTYARLADELGLEPGPALKALQAQILEQSPVLAVSAAPASGNASPEDGPGVASTPRIGGAAKLPFPLTSIVGRESELRAVTEMLTIGGMRLVTLTGPGGVGKTRLSIAIAHVIASSFDDGAAWVELAGVASADDVPLTLARAVGALPVPGEGPRDALGRFLASKRLLLVIDNFEHVLEAAGLIAELVSGCGGLTVLATSREMLAIVGEQRVVVEPLALPPVNGQPTVDEIEATAASAMFLAAVRRQDPRVTIDAAAASLIAQICARLDGLPLALELAAAASRLLSIEELFASLGRAFEELAGRRPGAPDRHRNLGDTISWSYRLLRPAEQSAFARFAVFAGGSTLDAARAVTSADLATLDALTTKSLLERRVEPGGTARLSMLETIRDYAQSSLAHNPEREEVRRRHCEHYLDLVERHVARLSTRQEHGALQILDREMDNIRAALGWSVDAAPEVALRLAGRLGPYWKIREDPAGVRWLDATLHAAGPQAPASDRARGQLHRGSQLSLRLQYDEAGNALRSALELFRTCGDLRGLAESSFRMARYASIHAPREAREHAEEACEYAKSVGDEALLGRALGQLAPALPRSERAPVIERAAELLAAVGDDRQLADTYMNTAYGALEEGSPDVALRLLDLALPLAQGLDTPYQLMLTLGNIGLARLLAGDRLGAREPLVSQLRLCRGQPTFQFGADEALVALAAMTLLERRPREAAALLGAAQKMGFPTTHQQWLLARLERDYFTPGQGKYGAAAWREAERDGAAFTYDEAIAHALEVAASAP